VSAPVDRPRAVRDEDRFAVAPVAAWLREQGVPLSDDARLEQFPGGASNLTYRLDDGRQRLILRRPPRGVKARSAHDMGREVRVLRALAGKVPVPRVLAFCQDEAVLGADFYVMEPIEGVILRQDLPPGLELSPTQAAALGEALVAQLAALHALDPAELGLADLGRGPGYPRRQIEGWADRYEKARTPDAAPFTAVVDWLRARTPADAVAGDGRQVLIHNDWRFDNLILDPADPTRVIGVLDWEMATLGDPLMDLGNSLAYWVEADDEAALQLMRRQPTHLPGMPTRAALVARYGQLTGLPTDGFRFCEVYGLFRLAVILQQIYLRYSLGQTRNPAFAHFGAAAAWLEQRCLQRIHEDE
jgi:aminoglycoside phosphotransferase (APT) family kinase protein